MVSGGVEFVGIHDLLLGRRCVPVGGVRRGVEDGGQDGRAGGKRQAQQQRTRHLPPRHNSQLIQLP